MRFEFVYRCIYQQLLKSQWIRKKNFGKPYVGLLGALVKIKDGKVSETKAEDSLGYKL